MGVRCDVEQGERRRAGRDALVEARRERHLADVRELKVAVIEASDVLRAGEREGVVRLDRRE